MQTHEEKLASGGTYIGAAITALSGLTLNEIGIFAGIFLGVCSFCLNLFFKLRLLRHIKEKGEVHIDVE